MKTAQTIILLVLAPLLGGCFTGVDSTPRIGDSEVRRRHVPDSTDEQRFIPASAIPAPHNWVPGQTLFRLDAAAPYERVFTPVGDPVAMRGGEDYAFVGTEVVPGLTGDSLVALVLADRRGHRFRYVTSIATAAWDTLGRLDIPYMTNLATSRTADRLMRGQKYFIRTPYWQNAALQPVRGLRHVEVHIDSVAPGTSHYPALVYFTIADTALARSAGAPEQTLAVQYNVPMTAGTTIADTRNFDRLFRFQNPRKLFADIKPEIWNLIVASRLRAGMSRDECRLALGIPDEIRQIPSAGGMREVWNYHDGTFLVFDEGFLSNFRQ